MSFTCHQVGEGYFSSIVPTLKSGISSATEFVHESALKGCDRAIQWISSYANDLPSYMYAKSISELDYVNDDLFWQGHFYNEIREIKKTT